MFAHASSAVMPRESEGSSAARAVAAQLFGAPEERDFDIRYWDGALERGGVAPAPFTLVLRRRGALRRMLLPPSELATGEAFVRGDVDVEGDIERAAGLGDRLAQRLRDPKRLARVMLAALALPRGEPTDARAHAERAPSRHGVRHTRARDAAAVRSHYDVGNEFYALWLDRSMTYSCAYFESGGEDIDAAQRAKLDHLCRKLRLSPGDRLLDIGCGWGGLVRHAARYYGAQALGITLSEPQAALARRRIREEGLEDRCRIEVRDYRDVEGDASFDRIVSVGMIEHVGKKRLPEYFGRAFRLLRPGGVFVNHGIVSLETVEGLGERFRRLLWRRGAFIDRYVFPDGELPTAAETLRAAEDAGFEMHDVEGLREHYALTLRQWVRRLERAWRQAEEMVGERTCRVWRLYMAASAHAFASGRLNLSQMVLARRDAHGRCDLPLTRRDLYPLPHASTVIAAD